VSRTVTLVLLDAAGATLGALPPYEVSLPWWQEVSDVVAGARARYGVDVAVLRMLHADRPAPPGGAVTYLAQLFDPAGPHGTGGSGGQVGPDGSGAPGLPLVPIEMDLPEHPLRARWAGPGAPAASVAWAAGELRRLGRPVGPAVQQRAWNLSTIWRFDDPAGGPPVAWLKLVPPFFAHEAVVLEWLAGAAPGAAPSPLATDGRGGTLLAHVAGEDRYGAGLADRHQIAAELHAIQVASAPIVDALVGAGLPDGRSQPLLGVLRAVAAGHPGLEPLVETLPRRLAEVARCGLPDVLVHGDAHPGNVRSAGAGPAVILDWGDSFAGHPAFDILRLAEDLPATEAESLVAAWARRWRRDAPGSDPARAVALLRPVAALRNAAMYAHFLANIEPSERPFHAADVPAWLARAASGNA
jgi:hypothetical protein